MAHSVKDILDTFDLSDRQREKMYSSAKHHFEEESITSFDGQYEYIAKQVETFQTPYEERGALRLDAPINPEEGSETFYYFFSGMKNKERENKETDDYLSVEKVLITLENYMGKKDLQFLYRLNHSDSLLSSFSSEEEVIDFVPEIKGRINQLRNSNYVHNDRLVQRPIKNVQFTKNDVVIEFRDRDWENMTPLVFYKVHGKVYEGLSRYGLYLFDAGLYVKLLEDNQLAKAMPEIDSGPPIERSISGEGALETLLYEDGPIRLARAAKIANIDRHSLKDKAKEGEIPFIQDDNDLRKGHRSGMYFDKSTVLRLIEKNISAIEGWPSVTYFTDKYDISRKLVKNMCRQGKIYATKDVGGIWRIRPEEEDKIANYIDMDGWVPLVEAAERMDVNYGTLYKWVARDGKINSQILKGKRCIPETMIEEWEKEGKKYKIPEAANILGVGDNALYEWDEKGEISFCEEPGGLYYVTEGQLIKLIKERTGELVTREDLESYAEKSRYNVHDVSKILNKHPATLYRWNNNGDIAFTKDVRGRSYLTNDQLLDVIEEHDINYYKITEAAGIAGVHQSTIYNWEKRERVSFVKDREGNDCITENQLLDML